MFSQTCKAALGRPCLVIQHRVDGPQGAGRELVIVLPVAAGGSREHDEVTVFAEWSADLWVVLEANRLGIIGRVCS